MFSTKNLLGRKTKIDNIYPVFHTSYLIKIIFIIFIIFIIIIFYKHISALSWIFVTPFKLNIAWGVPIKYIKAHVIHI